MSAPIQAVNTMALSLITQVIITREVTTRVDTAAAILGEAVLEEIAEEAMAVVVAVVGAATDRRCAHSRVACCFGSVTLYKSRVSRTLLGFRGGKGR